MNRIKDQYSKTLHFFFTDLRWWIFGTGIGFFALIFLSFFYFHFDQDLLSEIINDFAGQVEGMQTDSGDISVWQLFLNNFKACGISILFGLVPFLFITAILSVIPNAAVIGAMYALCSLMNISLVKITLFGILPHGIFELPAIVYCDAMGLYLCATIVMRICNGKRRKGSFVYAVKNIARTFLLIVTPLLIAAALIETYVTPVLLDAMI